MSNISYQPTEVDAVKIQFRNVEDFFWVSSCDAQRTKEFKWKKNEKNYVVGLSTHVTSNVFFTRWLLQPPEDMDVDHINCNTFDNTRSNLRIISPKDNQQNKKQTGHAEYLNDTGKYRARIRNELKNIHLGCHFNTKEEALQAIDMFLVHDSRASKFKRLNYPHLEDQYTQREYKPHETKQGTSPYRGVSWNTLQNKWVAQIQIKKKNHNLNFYDDEDEAARAYDAAVIKNRLPVEQLNFEAPLGYKPKLLHDYRLDPNDHNITIFDIKKKDGTVLQIKIETHLTEKLLRYHWHDHHNQIRRSQTCGGTVRLDSMVFYENQTDKPHQNIVHLDGDPHNNLLCNLGEDLSMINQRESVQQEWNGGKIHKVGRRDGTIVWYSQVTPTIDNEKQIYHFHDVDEDLCARWRDLFHRFSGKRKNDRWNFTDWTPQLEQQWLEKIKSNQTGYELLMHAKAATLATVCKTKKSDKDKSSKKRKRSD